MATVITVRKPKVYSTALLVSFWGSSERRIEVVELGFAILNLLHVAWVVSCGCMEVEHLRRASFKSENLRRAEYLE